jgi:5'-nucleotidase
MRILVTNDDGIDSVGLHVLARALEAVGDVFVVAPDSEYSGASAAVGPIHLLRPEVHRAQIDGFSGSVHTVSGPPALCVMFTRLGVFGELPDLVVAGINPGANVGRAVYHSGTVGAAITARTGGITGVAVSQSVAGEVDGQGADGQLGEQLWSSAADVAVQLVKRLIEHPPTRAGVLNVNVPNLPLEEMGPWSWASVGRSSSRTMAKASLEPRPGHEGSFRVTTTFGDQLSLPDGEDGGTVQRGKVALTWLSTFDRDESHEWDLSSPM